MESVRFSLQPGVLIFLQESLTTLRYLLSWTFLKQTHFQLLVGDGQPLLSSPQCTRPITRLVQYYSCEKSCSLEAFNFSPRLSWLLIMINIYQMLHQHCVWLIYSFLPLSALYLHTPPQLKCFPIPPFVVHSSSFLKLYDIPGP